MFVNTVIGTHIVPLRLFCVGQMVTCDSVVLNQLPKQMHLYQKLFFFLSSKVVLHFFRGYKVHMLKQSAHVKPEEAILLICALII